MCIDVTTGLPRPTPSFRLPLIMGERFDRKIKIPRVLLSPKIKADDCFTDSNNDQELPRTSLYIPKTKEEEAVAIKLIFSVFIEEIDGAYDRLVENTIDEKDDTLRRLYIALYDPRNICRSSKSMIVTSFLYTHISKRREEIDKSKQERHQVVAGAIAEYSKKRGG